MSNDRSLPERLASSLGRNPAEVAAIDRFAEGCVQFEVAASRLLLAQAEMRSARRKLEAAIVDAEADLIASDPDLAELNVQMDALYDLS